MAKNIKEKEIQSATAEDLERVISEINRQKQNAAEYNQNAGTVARGAIENYGLERTAFAFVRKLVGMEASKRNAVLASLIDYSEKLGLLDPGLFPNDLTERLQALVNRAHNMVATPRSDAEKAIDGALLGDA